MIEERIINIFMFFVFTSHLYFSFIFLIAKGLLSCFEYLLVLGLSRTIVMFTIISTYVLNYISVSLYFISNILFVMLAWIWNESDISKYDEDWKKLLLYNNLIFSQQGWMWRCNTSMLSDGQNINIEIFYQGKWNNTLTVSHRTLF